MKILNRIWFWLKAARFHTMPMSFMSWLVVFCYAVKLGGNIYSGILALIGVMSAHLGVNLVDDYFDFKREVGTIKHSEEKKSVKMQKGKCAYLLSGQTDIKTVGLVVCVYFAIAALIGLILTLICGWKVLLIAGLAAILCIAYPFLTYCGLSEFAVGMTFGPMLFAGVSIVMLGYIAKSIILMSISTGLLTIGLLHTHALMDYDCDVIDKKKTLCTLSGSKQNANILLGLMMGIAYVNIGLGIYLKIFPLTFLATFLTLPLAVALCYLLDLGIRHPEIIPQRKVWMGPMDNWQDIEKNNAQSFMLKFYISRNLMMFFTLLLCLGIIFS